MSSRIVYGSRDPESSDSYQVRRFGFLYVNEGLPYFREYAVSSRCLVGHAPLVARVSGAESSGVHSYESCLVGHAPLVAQGEGGGRESVRRTPSEHLSPNWGGYVFVFVCLLSLSLSLLLVDRLLLTGNQ